jgi:Ca2+-transporting ATPase
MDIWPLGSFLFLSIALGKVTKLAELRKHTTHAKQKGQLTSKMSKSRRSLSGALGKRSFLMTTSSSSATASELSNIPESSFVSTSAHSILPISSTPAPHVYSYSHQRSPSPPASSYFPSVSAIQSGEPQPTPGASTHFAYSTTLRRHHLKGSGLQLSSDLSDITSSEGLPSLWQKVKGVLARRLSDEAAENRYDLGPIGERVGQPSRLREDQDRRGTPSARFARWTVDVSMSFHLVYVSHWEWTYVYNVLETQDRSLGFF